MSPLLATLAISSSRVLLPQKWIPSCWQVVVMRKIEKIEAGGIATNDGVKVELRKRSEIFVRRCHNL
jgi:hypothetical protein